MKKYAVMEMIGNFSHTVAEFDSRDEAAEYVMNEALSTAKEQFDCLVEEIPPFELEEELENALSYYSIEVWNV